KPENIFLARSRREQGEPVVKLLDFGIEKVFADASTSADTAPVGTLLWMAPEQTEGTAALGPPTDVWALGLVAFFLLTGNTFWPLGLVVSCVVAGTASGRPPSPPSSMIRNLVVEPIPSPRDRAKELGSEV